MIHRPSCCTVGVFIHPGRLLAVRGVVRAPVLRIRPPPAYVPGTSGRSNPPALAVQGLRTDSTPPPPIGHALHDTLCRWWRCRLAALRTGRRLGTAQRRVVCRSGYVQLCT